jgi:hypothetical protein
MQPVWYLEGVAQYVAPKELLDLTIGEQLLIQIIAPFVPIVHIKMEFLAQKDILALLCRKCQSFVTYYQDNLQT